MEEKITRGMFHQVQTEFCLRVCVKHSCILKICCSQSFPQSPRVLVCCNSWFHLFFFICAGFPELHRRCPPWCIHERRSLKSSPRRRSSPTQSWSFRVWRPWRTSTTPSSTASWRPSSAWRRTKRPTWCMRSPTCSASQWRWLNLAWEKLR